jgi:hypothetical protein
VRPRLVAEYGSRWLRMRYLISTDMFERLACMTGGGVIVEVAMFS